MSDATSTYVADADLRKRAGLKGQHAYVTVRWETEPGRETDDCGQRVVDEILASQMHLEMMSESSCWMVVNGLRVWMQAVRVKGQREPRLTITAEPESCEPTREDRP